MIYFYGFFKGVGVGQAYAGITVLTYYSSLLAITLYYLIASFQKILPWSYCRDEWETNCVDSKPKSNATYQTKPQSSSELYFVLVFFKEILFGEKFYQLFQIGLYLIWFRKTVIHEYDDISEGIGLPDWRLTLALFISWLTTFLVIVKGVKTAGKAAYFLAIFPYVILITLLVRAVTLDGAIDGIIYFLKPNWSELLNLKVISKVYITHNSITITWLLHDFDLFSNIQVWMEAVVQCFFSLAVGLGPLVMFSSYNKFDHNSHR